jgi:hypothetical protein
VRAGAAFEAMLLAPMLRPMFAGSGALGEYGADILAEAIARGDRGGFAGVVAGAFERGR